MNREFLEALGLEGETLEQVLAAQAHSEKAWEEKLQKAHAETRQARFDGILGNAIAAAGGRNPKAIRALLDVEALQASEDVGVAAEAAVAALKNQNGYLFRLPAVPYAPGTGTGGFTAPEPQTLAGALKEKFGK